MPQLSVQDCGMFTSPCSKYGASPDGIVLDGDRTPVACLEIKCSPDKPPQLEPAYYYMCQLFLEMHCTGLQQVYYVSWTPDKGMNIFLVHWDDGMWELVLGFLQFLRNTPIFPICIRKDNQTDAIERVGLEANDTMNGVVVRGIPHRVWAREVINFTRIAKEFAIGPRVESSYQSTASHDPMMGAV